MTQLIRGIGYMDLVRMYARARGLNFWTVKQQTIARNLYNEHAALNN